MIQKRWSWGRRALGLLVVVLAVAGVAPGALAGVFDVMGVKVDVTAETAAKARQQARAKGERIAFARLLERLTLFDDRESLPLLSNDEVSGMVQDFEVAEEKTSAVRYLATLNYHFKADEVRRLLRDYGLPFAETVSKPVLVLPVYRDEGPRILWDEPNPWMQAWHQRPDEPGLVPLTVPLGDLTDISEITAEQAAQGDLERILKVARRYGAGTALVPAATLKMDPWKGRPILEVDIARYDDQGETAYYQRSFAGLEGEKTAALLKRAALELERNLEDNWKRDNLMRFGDQGVLAVTVPIGGLQDWLAVRGKLSGVPMVQRVEMVVLSRDEVRVNLHHIGTPDQVATALQQADLDLAQQDRQWVLTPAGQRAGPAG